MTMKRGIDLRLNTYHERKSPIHDALSPDPIFLVTEQDPSMLVVVCNSLLLVVIVDSSCIFLFCLC